MKGIKKMITKVSYKPYASSVSSTKNQPQKVNFGADLNPSEVGVVLACKLADLTSSGARHTIIQEIIQTLTFLKQHGGLSEEIYTVAMQRTSQFNVRSKAGWGFFGVG